MQQPINQDFANRVARYHQNRAKGLVFQADGTCGGVVPKRPARARVLWRAPRLLAMIALLFSIKACVFHLSGIAGYSGKLAGLSSSEAVLDQVVAAVLYPDPVTVAIAAQIATAERALVRQIRALR
jgi:hypothetical protein